MKKHVKLLGWGEIAGIVVPGSVLVFPKVPSKTQNRPADGF